MELIEARGATADFHDPHARVIPVTREYPQLAGRESVDLTPTNLATYDAVLISTDHDAIDWAALARHSRLIVDTRNACERAGVMGPHIVKA